MRLYAAAALGLLALTTTSARAATTRIRVAIPEFQLEGSPPPALGIQLQDGFVLGLGPRRRAGARSGRHREEARGPSRAAALRRLALPEGDRPAAGRRLHRARQGRRRGQQLQERRRGCSRPRARRRRRCRSRPNRRAATSARSPRRARSCCASRTRLRAHIEDNAPPAAPAARARRRPPPPRLVGPVLVAMVGALAIGAGFAVLATNGSCTATGCDENRTRSAAGGVLIGAGAALTDRRHLRHDRAQPRRRPGDGRRPGVPLVTRGGRHDDDQADR